MRYEREGPYTPLDFHSVIAAWVVYLVMLLGTANSRLHTIPHRFSFAGSGPPGARAAPRHGLKSATVGAQHAHKTSIPAGDDSQLFTLIEHYKRLSGAWGTADEALVLARGTGASTLLFQARYDAITAELQTAADAILRETPAQTLEGVLAKLDWAAFREARRKMLTRLSLPAKTSGASWSGVRSVIPAVSPVRNSPAD